MKHLLLPCSVAFLLALTSCKKNNSDELPAIVKAEVTPADSASFTINGKLYTAINIKSFGSGSAPANESVDALTNVVNWVGSPDTVTYFRNYTFTDFTNAEGALNISFVKKYAKAALNQVSTSALYYPTNPIELFTVGQHPYAIDFERERSHNGIAIKTTLANGGTSYSQIFLGNNTKLTASAQSNSTFQVTSVTKLKNGAYILQANFSVNLFDNNDNLVTRIENGYVRMQLY